VLLVLLLGTALQAQAQQKVIPLSSDQNDHHSVAIDNVLLTECGPDQLGFTMSFALLGGTLPSQERVFIIPQLMLKEQDVELEVTPQAIDYLAEMGYDPDFGARPVKRAIQQYMLNDLSKKLLSGDVNREKPIIVDSFGEGLVFRN
jgi:hypothetical protein